MFFSTQYRIQFAIICFNKYAFIYIYIGKYTFKLYKLCQNYLQALRFSLLIQVRTSTREK